jgi:ComEC/Rec2-related protein
MRDTVHRAAAWLAAFHGRHPLFVAALVTVACVLAAQAGPWWGGGVVIACALCGAACGMRGAALAWFGCGFIAVAVFIMRDATRQQAESALASIASGSMVRGRVLEDAKGNDRYWAAPVKLLGEPAHGVKVMWEGRGEPPVAGARVRAKGDFRSLPEPRNPGEFDRAAWLRRQGVAAVFSSVRGQAVDVEIPAMAAQAAKIRSGFRHSVTAGLADDARQAQIIRAVVIGEHPPDEPHLIDAFRLSGTLHVFSVSGLHVAMVGGIGWMALGFAGVPRRWALPALIALVFTYAWVTGNSAPAVRSAWMAVVFLGAFAFRRRPDLLNALGAVLLAAMLWDGRLLFQPGVQLSYGAVAAIAVGTAWAARSFAWMARPELYLPQQEMSGWQKFRWKLRCNIAGSLAVSLAASAGTTPLTALHFGIITPISVLASMVLVPLVFVLLSTALLAAALFPVAPPLTRGINHLNALTADACALTARGFAAIPGGHWFIRSEKNPALIIYDLEYGAGAACFIDGAGSAVLIDCGSPPGFRYVVAPSLRRLGIEPDSAALSHPDGGHLGGGAEVWQQFPIRQAWLPVKLSRSPAFREWIELAPAAGIRIHHTTAGKKIPLPDDATLEVLHAPDPLAHQSIADERVAIFRLHWRGWKILLTSDAGMGTELRLLDAGVDPAADLIIAGRHRTDITLCDRFIDAVDPLAIIASNPSYPETEQLPPASVAYWRSRGIHVIDQRQSGGVTLRVDEAGRLVIDGFLTNDPLLLTPR